MKKALLRLSVVLLAGMLLKQIALAQGIGINETGADPHPSAMLDVNSNSRGLLPPRMTTEERDAIQNPAPMLIIANTTTNCLEIYISPSWQNIFCGCSSAPANLSYTDNGPLAYCLNEGIAPNNASTQASAPGSYSVSPALPAGLQLNNANGQITGAPTTLSPSASYTINASNACGSATRDLNIEVIAIPATPTAIGGPSEPTFNTTAIYSIASVSGATSYTWTVPSGWTIDSGQGATSIHATAGANAGNVTVTANNTCGESPASAKSVTSWRPIVATGGAITNYIADGTNGVSGVQYRVHSFTTVGSSIFNVTDAGTDGQVDYLVVAGGGGGGGHMAGGGGAGGYRTGSLTMDSATQYTITVGAGGNGGPEYPSTTPGSSGSNSVFSTITSVGGGGGGTRNFGGWNGLNGGSGGGGGNEGGVTAGTGMPGQGNNGSDGTNSGASSAGGGGGGAGASGGNSGSNSGGAGGVGLQSSITGTATFYAGGGGGNAVNGTSASGGNGGGGAGTGVAGTSNTGGGGGGGTGGGGSGGSGIVIIRYPLTNPNL